METRTTVTPGRPASRLVSANRAAYTPIGRGGFPATVTPVLASSQAKSHGNKEKASKRPKHEKDPKGKHDEKQHGHRNGDKGDESHKDDKGHSPKR
jgi:hypothetical protein